MNTPSAPITRRVIHSTAAQLIGAALFILGLFLLVIFWPLALLCLLAALLLGAVRRTEYACGACGNHVAQTSTLCPTCRIPLDPPPSRLQRTLLGLGLITLILIAAVLLKRWMEGTL